jgi:hypothetical protein
MTVAPFPLRRADDWARTAASQVDDLLRLVTVPSAAAAAPVPNAPRLRQESCGCWVAGLQIHEACAEHAS